MARSRKPPTNEDEAAGDELLEAEPVAEEDETPVPIDPQAPPQPDPQAARHLPAVVAAEAIVARAELSVDEVEDQKDKIVQIMQAVMQEGVHYGRLPGINKPSLYKPGAEAINVALRLAPFYDSEKIWGPGEHLTVIASCTLKHIPTSLVIATGEGLCSSRETRYAYRTQKRKCPACGEEQIRRSKFPPKEGDYAGAGPDDEPGWYCWKKEGGCGANFAHDDPEIVDQEEGKIENPDLPDTWNTVLKMADKRALIAAVLNGTAASDVFTQDVEDSKAAAEEAADEASADRTANQRTGPRQQRQRRQEGPGPFPVPKNWPEIEKAVRSCDNKDEAWALFQAFQRAAAYHLFGVVAGDPQEDAALLKAEQWAVIGQKAAGAAVYLHDGNVAETAGEFYFFTEDSMRKAWAHVLDGALLEIPDYVAPIDKAAQEALDLEPEEERARQAEGGE